MRLNYLCSGYDLPVEQIIESLTERCNDRLDWQGIPRFPIVFILAARIGGRDYHPRANEIVMLQAEVPDEYAVLLLSTLSYDHELVTLGEVIVVAPEQITEVPQEHYDIRIEEHRDNLRPGASHEWTKAQRKAYRKAQWRRHARR